MRIKPPGLAKPSDILRTNLLEGRVPNVIRAPVNRPLHVRAERANRNEKPNESHPGSIPESPAKPDLEFPAIFKGNLSQSRQDAKERKEPHSGGNNRPVERNFFAARSRPLSAVLTLRRVHRAARVSTTLAGRVLPCHKLWCSHIELKVLDCGRTPRVQSDRSRSAGGLMFPRIFSLAAVLTLALSAQNGPTVTAAGYSFPTPVFSPGQILRLQVAGMKTALSQNPQRATALPLPTALAGVSVTITQTVRQSIGGSPTQSSYKAPLLAISQEDVCANGAATADCVLTLITFQVPYELRTAEVSPPIVQSSIVVSEPSGSSQEFLAGVVPDQIHVVTTCEDQPVPTACPTIVAHSDGTVVSSQSPARAGETVVIYAWGLGITTPQVRTGEASPSPAPVVTSPGLPNGLVVSFNFAANAPPSPSVSNPAFAQAYLTPGFVGLYQINVQLPASLPSLAPCGASVKSNLTINVGGMSSFGGAAICVQ
jgi:uncharacterized protein (TIGR03437 family)